MKKMFPFLSKGANTKEIHKIMTRFPIFLFYIKILSFFFLIATHCFFVVMMENYDNIQFNLSFINKNTNESTYTQNTQSNNFTNLMLNPAKLSTISNLTKISLLKNDNNNSNNGIDRKINKQSNLNANNQEILTKIGTINLTNNSSGSNHSFNNKTISIETDKKDLKLKNTNNMIFYKSDSVNPTSNLTSQLNLIKPISDLNLIAKKNLVPFTEKSENKLYILSITQLKDSYPIFFVCIISTISLIGIISNYFYCYLLNQRFSVPELISFKKVFRLMYINGFLIYFVFFLLGVDLTVLTDFIHLFCGVEIYHKYTSNNINYILLYTYFILNITFSIMSYFVVSNFPEHIPNYNKYNNENTKSNDDIFLNIPNYQLNSGILNEQNNLQLHDYKAKYLSFFTVESVKVCLFQLLNLIGRYLQIIKKYTVCASNMCKLVNGLILFSLISVLVVGNYLSFMNQNSESTRNLVYGAFVINSIFQLTYYFDLKIFANNLQNFMFEEYFNYRKHIV